jgi:hypothetical protein
MMDSHTDDIPREYLTYWVWYMTIRKKSTYSHRETIHRLPYFGEDRLPAEMKKGFEERWEELITPKRGAG